MVRITAIKINTNIIKLILVMIFIILIVELLKTTVLINFSFSSMIGSIDTSIYKNAIESTVITRQSGIGDEIDKQYAVSTIKKTLSDLMGFTLNDPKTILKKEFQIISVYEKSLYAMGVPESKYDIDENREIIIPDEEQKPEKAEVEPEVEIKESVTREEGITLTNETNYAIDINSIVNSKISLKPSKNGPQVLIYHTHSCESYTPSKKYKYSPSDTDRSNDINYSVVRVGEQLSQELRKYGIKVMHDKTIHDGDAYNRAYSKSEKTLQGYIKKYPSISLIIDLHRDAADFNGKKFRASTTISNAPTAQVMAVVGTDGRGLSHPYWRENLKLGVKFIYKMNQMYPGLGRGVNLKLGRFNQYLSRNAVLLEVGSNGNTLDEALNSTKYIAQVINEVIREAK